MNMAGRKTWGSESVEEEERGECGEGQRNLGESQSVEALASSRLLSFDKCMCM